MVRDDFECRRATRFTLALRLCISGCFYSTKASLLSVFVAPELDLRPHERQFNTKCARAPLRAQLRPAPSSFPSQDRLLFISIFFFLFIFFPRNSYDRPYRSRKIICLNKRLINLVAIDLIDQYLNNLLFL